MRWGKSVSESDSSRSRIMVCQRCVCRATQGNVNHRCVAAWPDAAFEFGEFKTCHSRWSQAIIDGAWGKTKEFFDLDAETKASACALPPFPTFLRECRAPALPSGGLSLLLQVSMGLDMSDDYPYGYIPLSGETLSAGKSAER